MTTSADKPLKIFCSYAHEDEEYANDLRDSLRGLERQGLIEWWHDRQIVPGWEWEEAIDKNLRTADVVLLLVSRAFMASDYVFEREINQAIERHKRGEARVIPIIVRPALWSGTPLARLQALPKDAKPITTWLNRDEAWLDVVKGIQKAVEHLSFEGQKQAARKQYRNAPGQAWKHDRVNEEEAEQPNAATNKEAIFISYRSADKPIAEVIRRNLSMWGFDKIYQAGAGAKTGKNPRVGEDLPDQLREALDEAQLVILIYTLADEDWSWCMWECGLATHPWKTDATRVIVFRCTYDTPRLFAEQVMVDVDPQGIRNFTRHLHRDDDVFPGKQAYRPGLTDADLDSISTNFYEQLRGVIPTGYREDRYRWDRFTLRLEPPVDRLNFEMDEDDLCKQIQSELVVTQPFGNALEHFGYAKIERGLKLSDLVGRWKEETRDRENISKDWIKGLCLEIRRAITAYPPEPSWQQLNSVRFRAAHYYPVVNHVRVLPDDSMEIDVYFYPEV